MHTYSNTMYAHVYNSNCSKYGGHRENKIWYISILVALSCVILYTRFSSIDIQLIDRISELYI